MNQWSEARNELVYSITSLGFPGELGECIARHLGSPRAIWRMVSYLQQAQPDSAEVIVDEMLSIKSEIDAWRAKKDAEQANAAYNALLYYGLDDSEDESL